MKQDCVPVELAKSYRLLNHGPTMMVSSLHAGKANVMSAAWSMPLDFAPPKVAVVIDKATFTRGLITASPGPRASTPARRWSRAAWAGSNAA